jgi:hypothetical protein
MPRTAEERDEMAAFHSITSSAPRRERPRRRAAEERDRLAAIDARESR